MNDAQRHVILCELTRLPMPKIQKEFDGITVIDSILNRYSFEDCVKRIKTIKDAEQGKINEKLLRGLCVDCVRRKRCPTALQYKDIKKCQAHKVNKNRGKKRNER